MSCDRRNLDGTVSVRRTIEFYETMSELEYEIKMVLATLSDADKEKLKKYLIRLTKGRVQFTKKRKYSLKGLRAVDAECREIYSL